MLTSQSWQKFNSLLASTALKDFFLYLNNLFYYGEHFQTQQFLVKHWRNQQKERLLWTLDSRFTPNQQTMESPDKKFFKQQLRSINNLEMSQILMKNTIDTLSTNKKPKSSEKDSEEQTPLLHRKSSSGVFDKKWGQRFNETQKPKTMHSVTDKFAVI